LEGGTFPSLKGEGGRKKQRRKEKGDSFMLTVEKMTQKGFALMLKRTNPEVFCLTFNGPRGENAKRRKGWSK